MKWNLFQKIFYCKIFPKLILINYLIMILASSWSSAVCTNPSKPIIGKPWFIIVVHYNCHAKNCLNFWPSRRDFVVAFSDPRSGFETIPNLYTEIKWVLCYVDTICTYYNVIFIYMLWKVTIETDYHGNNLIWRIWKQDSHRAVSPVSSVIFLNIFSFFSGPATKRSEGGVRAWPLRNKTFFLKPPK